ncbi:unnamed protein product [Cyprideis torosa]|uniref:Uncharacterized protein n=1 Tax=Cyprideis torosa TaxID=163714 RepID=A0A7R8ZLQ8_9CRUS|nr:unnamed protein product [Cyprideis torosa]CAG0892400.1 unnamed protein product [Cyprideis torosa]
MRTKLGKSAKYRAEKYEETFKVQPPSFSVGNLVYLKKCGVRGKLAPLWEGPFRITCQESLGTASLHHGAAQPPRRGSATSWRLSLPPRTGARSEAGVCELRRRGLAHEFRSQIVFARVPYLKTPEWMHLDGFIYIIAATVFFASQKAEVLQRLRDALAEAGEDVEAFSPRSAALQFQFLGFLLIHTLVVTGQQQVTNQGVAMGEILPPSHFNPDESDAENEFGKIKGYEHQIWSSSEAGTETYSLRPARQSVVEMERSSVDRSVLESEPDDADADEVARLEAQLAQVDSLRK